MANNTQEKQRKLVNRKGQSLETDQTDKEAFNTLEELVRSGERIDSFSMSLVAQGNSNRGISEEQFWWVHKLSEPINECEVLGTQILTRFTNASFNGVKTKNLKLSVSDSNGAIIVISFAGPRSKHYGDIWVLDDGQYPNNRIYGRISRDTGIFIGRNVPENVQQVVEQVNSNPDNYMPW